MKLGILDRALAKVGLARRSVFSGAQGTRLTLDWIAGILSADQEIKANLRMLRARGRDLVRNNAVAKCYTNMLSTNVVGANGITYQAQIRNNDGKLNKPFNKKIEESFREWSKPGNCTVDGRISFRGVQDLAARNVAPDGEVFVRMVFGFPNKWGFALQFIDPDQIDGDFNRPAAKNENEIRLGVEVDHWGRPVAYHFREKHPSEGGSFDRIRIPAEQVIHLYDPLRVNSTRGVTWFHPVLLPLRMLEGYIEAELVAARTGAAKMGFFKYTDAAAYDAPDPKKGSVRMDAQPGVIDTIPPGLEFQEWSPDHPANAFPAFVQAILRQIATGLGVSYNALANDLVGVNYSSMRSGLLIERDNWRRLQNWFSEILLQRVFEGWLRMALLSGELVLDSRDSKRFLAGKWNPRGWQWVDPLKDVQAAILAINARLDTRSAIVAERGEDFEEIIETLAEEQEIADEYDVILPSADMSTNKPNTDGSQNDGTAGGDSEEASGGEAKVEPAPAKKGRSEERDAIVIVPNDPSLKVGRTQ